MSLFNRLVASVAALALAGGVVGPAPLQARTAKGDKFFAQGARYAEKKEYDAALAAYQQALAEDPSEVAYQIAVDKTRAEASFDHLEKGLKLRNQGNLIDALAEVRRAYAIDPSNTAASQEIIRTQDMIDRERRRVQETGKEAPPEVRAETPAEEAHEEVRAKIDRMLPLPELKPLNPEKINLKINNQPPKVLFDTVAKVAGLNVIWDPEYQQGRNVSIDLNNSTVEEALDDVALLTKSFWKALPGGNTIFVTNDNRNKRNDYEDQVLKVFYLSNVNTPQELQEIVNAVRAVTELTRLMPYNSLHAIIARGEADRIALAEKIINDLDRPRSEVVVDVLVMQASSDFSRQITAALASTGLNVPVNFNPRSTIQSTINNNSSTTNNSSTSNTTTTNTSTTSNTTASVGSTTTPYIPLSNLGHLSSADFAITLPGALLQAALSNANTKILQAPELRSVDNSKASLKIGEREPTATGSFQPGIGGVGINPLVNTQFTYIDVGVNVDIQPQVHENDEVSMHVEMDISSVAGYVNLGGINQPIIQQNKVVHDLRVREGEVSLLAGLSQQQDTSTITGIPGLSSIPLLGNLFKGRSIDHSKSELIIALIPHIVRRPDITPENLKGIAVGNATTVKLNYAPRTMEIIQPKPPVGTPTAPAGQTPVPATAPAPAGVAPAPTPQAPPPSPPGAPRAFFQPAQVDTTMGSNVTVSLAAASVTGAMNAPLQIHYDPKVLRLNDITAGDLMAIGNQQPTFTKNIQNDAGTATVQLTRPPGSPGVSGGGTLINLIFQAVGRGATNVTVPNMTLTGAQGQPVLNGSPQVTVNVK